MTADGKEVKGRLLNHDTYTVQLLDWDEQLRSFDEADLREFAFEDTPMPSARRSSTRNRSPTWSAISRRYEGRNSMKSSRALLAFALLGA